LALVLALVACASEGQVQEISADEIRQAVLDAAEEVQTLRFETELTVRMQARGEQDVDLTVSADSNGQIDNLAQVMVSEMTSTVYLPPEAGGNKQSTVTSYVVDGVLYARTTKPDQTEQWSSQRMVDWTWEDLSQLGHEAGTLRTAELELLGSGRLRGVDCYLLEVTPNTDNLRQRLEQLPGLEGLPADEQAALDELIEEFSTKVWVEKDTFHLLRDETEITLNLDSDLLAQSGAQQNDMTLDAEMRTDFTDYDQPLAIELPPEASGTGSS
jgi:hypothetical protein